MEVRCASLPPRHPSVKDRLTPGSFRPSLYDSKPSKIVWVHCECAKVTYDSFADICSSEPFLIWCLHTFSLEKSLGHSGCNLDVSASVLDLSEDNIVGVGTIGLLQPACLPHQKAHAGSAVGSTVPVGTGLREPIRIQSRFWRRLQKICRSVC